MRWVERGEKWSLAIYRALLLVAVAAAFAGTLAAGGYWLVAKVATRPHQALDYLAAPAWEELRSAVLPALESGDAGGADAEGPPAAAQAKPLIDPRVAEIHAILARQFERNEGGVRLFRQLVPRRHLQEMLLADAGLPDALTGHYLDSAQAFARSLAEDGRINRIASMEARAETLLAALHEFKRLYVQRLAGAQAEAGKRNLAEGQRQGAMDVILTGALPLSFGALALLILLMAVIRIEAHLRLLATDPEAPAGRQQT